MTDKLRVFLSEHCLPCQDIMELIKQGKVSCDKCDEGDEIEVVDITSDEGFPLVAEYELDGVPAAFLGKKQCKIDYDEEEKALLISCPEE